MRIIIDSIKDSEVIVRINDYEIADSFDDYIHENFDIKCDIKFESEYVLFYFRENNIKNIEIIIDEFRKKMSKF